MMPSIHDKAVRSAALQGAPKLAQGGMLGVGLEPTRGCPQWILVAGNCVTPHNPT